MTKIPVYFMPGLAASPAIFEYINLPKNEFEMYFLEWFVPEYQEDIAAYAFRMAQRIKHEKPVLIGVSFGGILVQEIAKHIDIRQLIIISSVKSNTEFPPRFQLARKTKCYKMLPLKWLNAIEKLSKFANGNGLIAKRIQLYEKYLAVRDVIYLDWAIENVLLWKQKEINKNCIHIHGDADGVFPIEYIKNCIIIHGGTHLMIINKYKWFNENLPKIITNVYEK